MTTAHTFTNNEIKLHWLEDYVTEGLNKQQTAESHGIVRGFDLAGQAPLSVNQFRLLVDAAKGDSVCCVRNSDNRVITVVRGLDIMIDMSGLGIPNGKYWIVCQVDYAIGASTVGTIEVYNAAEMAANAGKYAVLGWVNWDGIANLDLHPVAGTPTLGMADYSITTGGSSPYMREIARNLESKDRVPWQKMIRFSRADEYMEIVSLLPEPVKEWKQSQMLFLNPVSGLMEVDDTSPLRGDLHYRVNVKSDGTPGMGVRTTLTQKMVTHVKEGDIIRMSIHYNVPAAIPNGWTIGYGVLYFDKDGNYIAITGASAAVAAIDLVGNPTVGYVKVETEVHVIGNRNIEYAMPFVQCLAGDDTGADALIYFDDIEMEVLSTRGPELDPSVDSEERVMQPVKASVLHIEDWEWDNALAPTKMDLVAWAAYCGGVFGSLPLDGRTLRLERVIGPATPPYPIVQIGPQQTGLVSGIPPAASRHRQALFRPNTPRAWAAIQWTGAAFGIIDSYGFDKAFGVVKVVAGHYRMQFENDENGSPWIYDQNYSVQFGTLQQLTPPGPGVIVDVVLYLKVLGPPKQIEFTIWESAALPPFHTTKDMVSAGDEIYISIFADD